MRQGDRVETPDGLGTVAYVRLDPPLFLDVRAVSVVLDRKRHIKGYFGSIYPAEKVKLRNGGNHDDH